MQVDPDGRVVLAVERELVGVSAADRASRQSWTPLDKSYIRLFVNRLFPSLSSENMINVPTNPVGDNSREYIAYPFHVVNAEGKPLREVSMFRRAAPLRVNSAPLFSNDQFP